MPLLQKFMAFNPLYSGKTPKNSLLFNLGNYFLFGKHQALLIDRTNQPLVNITYFWHTFCQQNLFLACFVYNNCAGLLIWFHIQSNLDYSKCQGPHESFRIIGSSNDRKQEFSDIFGKARTFHRTALFCQSSHLQLVFSVK